MLHKKMDRSTKNINKRGQLLLVSILSPENPNCAFSLYLMVLVCTTRRDLREVPQAIYSRHKLSVRLIDGQLSVMNTFGTNKFTQSAVF